MLTKWFAVLSEAAATAAPAAETASNALVSLPLFTKGLLTTVMGLAGVFLVLTLFFITIKLMQKIGPKESK